MSQNVISSLPNRAQSPVNLPRGAHPGAVLLSPKSSSVNLHRIGTNPTSPSQQAMSLNDLLDQQAFTLDSQMQIRDDLGRPSNLVSPLSNTAMNPSASNGSTFLDSFSRPTSSMAVNQVHQQTLPLQPTHPNTNVVVNFTNDVNQLCNWISMLTTSQQNTVMDNLLSSLNEEVLHNTKLKLDSMVHSGYLSPNSAPLVSPIPNRLHPSNQSHENPQALNLDSVLSGDSLYRQWSPLPQNSGVNHVQQPLYDYLNEIQRPRSADPYNSFKKSGSNNINSNNNNNNHTSNNNINNCNSNLSWKTHSSSQNNNRPSSPSPIKGNGFSKPMTTSLSNSGNALTTVSSASSVTSNSNGSNNNSMNAKALCDPKLLKNIPAWLKSLRLHKYSDALGGSPWHELIYLDDETLEKMGVSALGARRKLLKAFSIVKEYKENDLIDPTAFS